MAKNSGSLIGNTSLAMVREPRCRICQSPLRDRIDRLSVGGFGGTAIADEIMGLDPNLAKNRDALRKGIERHVKLHLKIKDAAIRQILENRAKEQGVLIDQYKGRLVSGKAFLDLMVAQATEQITEPGARVYFKDALDAIRLQEEFERANFAQQLEVVERQVWSISQAVKEILKGNFTGNLEDLYPAIAEKARDLFEMPILEGVGRKHEPAPALELEAEIIEVKEENDQSIS